MVNFMLYFTTIKNHWGKTRLLLWPEVNFFSSESPQTFTYDFLELGETRWQGLSVRAGSVSQPPPVCFLQGLAGCLALADAGWMKGQDVGAQPLAKLPRALWLQ